MSQIEQNETYRVNHGMPGVMPGVKRHHYIVKRILAKWNVILPVRYKHGEKNDDLMRTKRKKCGKE